MPKKTAKENLEAPATLKENMFFGLKLDGQQKEFRDAIWSNDYDIVFCDSKSGTGKTLISVATAKLLVEYGRYDGLVYIVSPTQSERNGFLPGGIVEKEMPYFAPIFDALITIGEQPEKAIKQMCPENGKNGLAWVDCMSHTYMRGINLQNKCIILEETQNYYSEELKKVLTRVCFSSKVIVIGHREQIDLYKNPQNSGFSKYIEHFKDMPKCKVCELTHNYRGWVSTHADELDTSGR
jgi:phosphate starvation-inducible protein PhoH and related proteins